MATTPTTTSPDTENEAQALLATVEISTVPARPTVSGNDIIKEDPFEENPSEDSPPRQVTPASPSSSRYYSNHSVTRMELEPHENSSPRRVTSTSSISHSSSHSDRRPMNRVCYTRLEGRTDHLELDLTLSKLLLLILHPLGPVVGQMSANGIGYPQPLRLGELKKGYRFLQRTKKLSTRVPLYTHMNPLTLPFWY